MGTELLPAYLHDVRLIEEVALDRWRELFDAVGYPAALESHPLTHASIERVLFAEKVDTALIDALETIEELRSERGRECLVRSADDLGCSRASWPTEFTSGELALHLWIRQFKDDTIAAVLSQARIRAFETGTRRPHQDFAGKSARRLSYGEAELRTRVQEEAIAWLRVNERGNYAEVKCYVRGDDTVFQVIHAEPIKSELAIVDGERAAIRFHPAHADLIRYDAAEGRLRVSARSLRLVDAYRRIFGAALFDEVDFFSGAVECTLRPLQERGRDALRTTAGVLRVRLLELTWHRGGARHRIRSADDCFDEVEQLKLPIHEGTLTEAKLEFSFLIGQRVERRTVSIRTPNRIAYRPDRFEDRIEHFLKSSGIRVRTPPKASRDFWSVAATPHPEAAWRDALGRQMNWFMRAALLRDCRLDVLYPPGASPLVVTEHGDELVGLSEDGLETRRLSATEVQGLVFEAERFAERVAEALRLSGPRREVYGGDGAWDVGAREFSGVRVHVFLLVRRPAPPHHLLAQRLQEIAGNARLALIVPPGCTTAAGLPEVAWSDGPEPLAELPVAFIRHLRLEAHASAVEQASPDALLIVDRRQGAAFYGGVPLAFPAESHPFKFLSRLAEAAGSVVSTGELNKALSPMGGPKTARDARKRLEEGFRRSFRNVNREEECPDLKKVVVTRNGGYALCVPSFIA